MAVHDLPLLGLWVAALTLTAAFTLVGVIRMTMPPLGSHVARSQ
jgi:hypothetical protein